MAYKTSKSTAIFQVLSSSFLPLNLLCVNSNSFLALLKHPRLLPWGLCNMLPCLLDCAYSKFTHSTWNSYLLPQNLAVQNNQHLLCHIFSEDQEHRSGVESVSRRVCLRVSHEGAVKLLARVVASQDYKGLGSASSSCGQEASVPPSEGHLIGYMFRLCSVNHWVQPIVQKTREIQLYLLKEGIWKYLLAYLKKSLKLISHPSHLYCLVTLLVDLPCPYYKN